MGPRTAAAFDGSLVVVHAVGLLEEGGYRPRPDVAAIVEDAYAVLSGPPGDHGGLRGRTGGGRLIRVAEREHAGLIVVGRRGLGGAAAARFGERASVAHADVPVLVVPRP